MASPVGDRLESALRRLEAAVVRSTREQARQAQRAATLEAAAARAIADIDALLDRAAR